MGLVQTVDVDVELNSQTSGSTTFSDAFDSYTDVSVKSLTVNRNYGAGGSTAKIKALFPEGFPLEEFTKIKSPGANVAVQITIKTSYKAEQPKRGGVVYTGNVTDVTKNDKGVVTIECLDRRLLLNRSTVTVDTGQSLATTDEIVQNLLGDDLGLTEGEPDVPVSEQPDVDFIVDVDGIFNNFEPSKVNVHYGTSRPTPLINVLTDLAKREDCALWIDRYNVIHFERTPPLRVLNDVPAIIEFNAGDTNRDRTSVIVDSAYDETGLGAFSFTASSSSSAQTSPEGGDNLPEGLRLRDDNNIGTRTDPEKRSTSQFVSDALSSDIGDVKTTGLPGLEPYDLVAIKDPPDELSHLDQVQFTVKTVTHKVDAKNGFTTKIGLGEDLESLFLDIADAHNHAQKMSSEIDDEVGFWERYNFGSIGVSVDANPLLRQSMVFSPYETPKDR